MIKKDTQGFAVVQALLLCVVVAAISGVAIYVYAQRDKQVAPSKSSDTSQQTQQAPTPQKTITTSPAANASSNAQGLAVTREANGYIEFTQLGIKIKRSSLMYDWSFVTHSDAGDKTVYVESAAYSAKIDACVAADGANAASYVDKSFAAFSRVSGTPDPNIPGDAPVKQFDGFYIGFGVPNGSQCANQPARPAEAIDALSEALGSVESL